MMPEFKYRNKTDQPLDLVGVGHVEPNGIIVVSFQIENPNLELITKNNELFYGDDPVDGKSRERKNGRKNS